MRSRIFLAAFLCMTAAGASAETLFEGWVSAVQNGNTITVITRDEQRVRIQIAGIDAPEIIQDYGKESAEELSRRILNKVVLIRPVASTGERSFLAQIARNDQDIGLGMVESGCAWAFAPHSSYLPQGWDYAYAQAERVARDRRYGLWATGSAVPPWSWRKLHQDEINAQKNKELDEKDKNLWSVTKQIGGQLGLSEEVAANRNRTATGGKSFAGKVSELITLSCQWVAALVRTILFLN